MKYSYLLSMVALSVPVACASDDSSSPANESPNAGGAGASAAGSSSTGGAASGSVVAAGLPDPGAANALSQNECYVGLKIPNVTYSGASCSGTSNTSSVSAIGPKSWDDVRLSLSIGLDNPPAIGKLALASLTIRIPNADGTSSSFDAPVDACTATATASANDTFMGWIYYSIDIACTKPAMPTTDSSLAPLPLNEFAIVTFFKA